MGRLALILMAGASLAACASLKPKYAINDGQGSAVQPPSAPGVHGTNAPYQVGGIWYVPHDQPHYDETGIASWYGDAFQMKATANGEIFDMNQFSAAHTTLPLPSMVEVTNLDNGKKLVVRVNDRGPFVGGRLIDLSHAAARELGYDRAGTAHVRVRYMGPAPLAGPDAGVRYAQAAPGGPPVAAIPAAAAVIAVSAPFPGATSNRRPADEEIFGDAPASPPASTPLVARPVRVSVTSLAPLPSASPRGGSPGLPDAAANPVAATTAQIFRIQAGAFSDQANARRAAAQLASTGTATIEPIERGGVTLYRVVLPGPSDEAEAFAFRDKVAAIGFADARVLRP